MAIAASTAVPPARRIASPADVARWCGATTAPWDPLASAIGTSGRVTPASLAVVVDSSRLASPGPDER